MQCKCHGRERVSNLRPLVKLPGISKQLRLRRAPDTLAADESLDDRFGATAIDAEAEHVLGGEIGGAFRALAVGRSEEHGLVDVLEEGHHGLADLLRLHVLERLVTEVIDRGITSRRIVLLGFSQGACLTAEFAIRHPRRYGGVMVLSGGLIGPPGTAWSERGGLASTPVFFGCSNIDPHIPEARVRDSAEVFRRMGADVTARIYPGMGHLVNEDELGFARDLLATFVA